ncbi:hypothetical protein, partial [uncultured Roseobacter sp.]|uniref:hypothetical protein n=1 Tax=uncultured Roseobacter sp. TaxID=114847 RepID=UPI00260E4A87
HRYPVILSGARPQFRVSPITHASGWLSTCEGFAEKVGSKLGRTCSIGKSALGKGVSTFRGRCQKQETLVREIEGINDAMAVLRPHWKDIEAEFDRQNVRYLAMAETDHEAIGRVLRAHLIVENFMNSYLVGTFKLEDFDGMKLTFAQKAKMLPQRKSSAAWVRPGIIQLNAVRNKLGHRLDHVVEFSSISTIQDVLSVARDGVSFESPIDAIEAFAPVACAFLTVPPRHLANAFSEAFSYVHSITPSEV